MKQNTTYKFLLLILIIIGNWSCERDDICADITPTTPHLIIDFKNIADPDVLKSVRELTVRALDDNGMNLEDIPVDSPFNSIMLPLRTDTTGPITTQFSLEKDSDFDNEDPATPNSNIDIISVTYTPENVYVSRACGYKSIYTNLSVTIIPDGSNWILMQETLTTTIENENEAQVILRH